MIARLGDLFGELADKVERWGLELFLMLPNFVAALLVVVAAWLISKGIGRLVVRLLERTRVHAALSNLVYKLTRVASVLVGLIIALQILELDKAATTFLAGAGILGLALGFAFQDLTANFIAGIALALRRPMGIGDIIESNGLTGRVRAIHLRHTKLRVPNGKIVIIPNRKIFENPLINFSREGKLRVDVTCGVHYDTDLEEARQAVMEALRSVPHVKTSPLEVFFERFGASSIELVARFWTPYRAPVDMFRARSAAIMAIKAAFDARGIVMPFPIRTLELGGHAEHALRQLASSAGEPPPASH